MKKIFALLALTLICFAVQARTVQHVTLKNGTTMHGFVQRSAKGMLTFYSDSAVVVISQANVTAVAQDYTAEQLDSVWIRWAEANNAFRTSAGNRILTLYNLNINTSLAADSVANVKGKDFAYYIRHKGSINKVLLLEQGSNVKYLEYSPENVPTIYEFSWDDVLEISIDQRPQNLLSGIDLIYYRNGKTPVEGQPAGETRKTLSVYQENGMKMTVNYDDVVKIATKPINQQQFILEQTELLDVVQTNDGRMLRGLIVEYDYTGKTKTDNFIRVTQKSGVTESVRLSDVQLNYKEVNPDYAPLYDLILKEGQILIDGKAATFVTVKKFDKEDVFFLDSLKNPIEITKGTTDLTKILVQYHLSGQNESFKIVKLQPQLLKRKIDRKVVVDTIYTFSYKDLVESAYTPVETPRISASQTTECEYHVLGKGVLLLVDIRKKQAVPFIIK